MRFTINLIRHGVTEGNQKKWYYGDADLPLTNEGVDKLTALASEGIYPEAEGKKLYTSGLLRTEQTFFLIYGGLAHTQVPGLKEYKFGEFEQKSYEELKNVPEYIKWIEDKEYEYKIPGGESISGFEKRVNEAFLEIIEREQDGIIVCHGGVISAIMQRYFPNQKEHFFAWVPGPGRGYALTFENNKPSSFTEI